MRCFIFLGLSSMVSEGVVSMVLSSMGDGTQLLLRRVACSVAPEPCVHHVRVGTGKSSNQA